MERRVVVTNVVDVVCARVVTQGEWAAFRERKEGRGGIACERSRVAQPRGSDEVVAGVAMIALGIARF